MERLPEVLTGGYPNSGTSFLCHLVVQLGKSPGSPENLKGPDSHNRWGYFEHLPIRELAWEAGGWQHFAPDRKGFLPDEPLVFDDGTLADYADRIRRIAEEDGVEVYKDSSLPLTFRLFPKESKYIIITRRVEAIYESPQKAGMSGYQCSLEELRDSHRKYHELVGMMAREVDCLTVQHEDFKTNFDGTLQLICNHLEIELDEIRYAACREIFRPRHFGGRDWMDASKLERLRRGVREDGLQTIPAWALRWVYWKGGLYHLRPHRLSKLLHRLPELRFQAMEKFGLMPEVRNSDFEKLDPELSGILVRATSGEGASLDLAPWTRGSIQQRQRIALVAELCARRYPGDFIEIGAYLGETTTRLAEVAREYHRRVIAVDPWESGTQNCERWEFDAFLKNIEPYADIVDVVRASSLDRSTKSLIGARALCFAFVDGLHSYAACLSDIRAVAHTRGMIAVDDVLWTKELMLAFRRGAYLTRRDAVHHPLCREGYLLPPRSLLGRLLSNSGAE